MQNEILQHKRHSLAHLLAAAVMELWPNTKRAIGPAIDNGFYFDFEFPEPINEKDLERIEKKMREISKSWTTFERHELTAEEAKNEYPDNPYKHELINEFTKNGESVSFYKSGNYWDLCKGGHTDNFKDIVPSSWKLDKITGAYWRGNAENPMLTRIYGLAFETKAELDEYIKMLEEAKKRDHKKLGPALDLFTFSDLVGPGLPLWTPKGALVRSLLDDYVWSLRKAKGYEKVEIPHITKKDLYETSGHWDKFKDELFRITTREGHEFAMKPMNCPHHTQIYARKPHSYKQLPVRYANTTVCYRDEQTGELSGLSRVRAFAQDDAHVFCRSSQVKQEMEAVWDIIESFYTSFGFKLEVRLSFHDPEQKEKYLGTSENWEFAEAQLKELVEERKTDAEIVPGEAAFYGPKIDFLAHDSIGRRWQVATIQMDMNMPQRFNLNCINEEGKDEQVVMIHAAIMGSIERFLSIFIEHSAGNFPLWLSPVQIAILPISDKFNDYASKIKKELEDNLPSLRIEIDDRSESVGKKIREASMSKIPYQIIVGEKEEQDNNLSVRARTGEDLGSKKVSDFLELLVSEVQSKK